MLGKLLKHEFKANIKAYAPAILLILIVSGIIKVMIHFIDLNSTSLNALFIACMCVIFMFVFGCIGLLFSAIFLNAYRFQKNLLSDEGYLMNTLPVPPSYHIITKLVAGLVWYILFAATVLISCLIAFTDADDVVSILPDVMKVVKLVITEEPLQFFLSIILSALSYSALMLLIYTGCSLSVYIQKGKSFITFLSVIISLILNSMLMSFVSILIEKLGLYSSDTAAYLIYIAYFALLSTGLFFAVNATLKNLNIE